MRGWTIAVVDSGVAAASYNVLAGKIISEACYLTESAIEDTMSLCPKGWASQVTWNPGYAARGQ